MEAVLPHGGLWGLTLLPPALLLAALCARCRRPRPLVDNYDCKPHNYDPPGSFILIPPHRPPQVAPGATQPLPPPWGAPAEPLPPQPSPQGPRVASGAGPAPPEEERGEGEEEEDDYSNEPFATGYVHVLPEAAAEEEAAGGGATPAPGEEYENVPEASLADSLEYINVPPGGPPPRDASESEDGPDYENL